jgi:hypothetical protein
MKDIAMSRLKFSSSFPFILVAQLRLVYITPKWNRSQIIPNTTKITR